MLGYCATGRVASATAPISTMTMASTLASTGRLMKNAEIIEPDLRRSLRRRGRGRARGGRRSGWRRSDGRWLGHDLAARYRLAVGRQHDPVVGGEARRDHPQAADQELARHDALLLADVVLVDCP